ncbi:ROK family transcriptional regulator [Actinomyces ruminicola]|uniref:Sugar kinase of the NBD/HSP70 family, may contain an N-terminal HTH domain n=1 Tax=Actinomyces ruminicola TaxID=332524 RepID=A0A1G9WVJ0_9ACTO|nr:ROK family transcriptional regulator [Actinomyces ruminicola]SDM88518.1 Sugar kinase of the NBD/HSP70 family, may contain an N-terminal HTH domain [Actinomyces ruminicola]
MTPRRTTAGQLRWTLAADVCTLLRAIPGITRAQIARRLGISSGTAADLVTRMRQAALLEEGEAVPNGRGRPTAALTAHPRGPLVLAVEITATGWRISTAGVDGRPVAVVSGSHSGRSPREVLAALHQAVEVAAEDHAGRVRAVSVAVAATVRNGSIVQSSVLNWQRTSLTPLAVPGAELFVTNDGTCEALAESRRGAARNGRSSLHVTVLNGVGGGLVLNGAPVLGATGLAMEIGHLPLGDPDAVCGCGARGCWDTVLGADALSRTLGLRDSALATAEAAITQAAPHDVPAIEAAAASLGRGLAGLINTTDPDIVTLGGIGPLLRSHSPAAFETALMSGLMHCLRDGCPRIVSGELGPDAASIGAIEIALDSVTSPAGLAAWAAHHPQ